MSSNDILHLLQLLYYSLYIFKSRRIIKSEIRFYNY